MVHRALILALLTAALGAPAAQASPPARVVLTSCTHDRAAVFEGRVHAIPGTVRMQMRFVLQARAPRDPGWAPVKARGFGTWLTSAAGVRRFVYVKRVEQLLAGESYRAVVRFRWLGSRGRVLDTARSVSARCTQPDLRPNLVVRRVEVDAGGDAGSRRYVAVVANAGRSPSGPFSLALSAAATPLGVLRSPGAAPGEVVRLALTGPACAEGAEIAAEADPEAAVDESDETDDRAVTPCPAG